MRQARPRPPHVYEAIVAITSEFAMTGIAKAQVNSAGSYRFRGIDDVSAALSPLLARHKLCILPRVLERTLTERQEGIDARLIRVSLRVAFDLVSSRDGSIHTIEAYGEGLDGLDKATAKAMTAAYKQGVLQTFCIPVRGATDGDADGIALTGSNEQPDPLQGWDQWASDLRDVLGSCETAQAIGRVQDTYRTMLRIASKRRPDLYLKIGEAVNARRMAIAGAISLPIEAQESQHPDFSHA